MNLRPPARSHRPRHTSNVCVELKVPQGHVLHRLTSTVQVCVPAQRVTFTHDDHFISMRHAAPRWRTAHFCWHLALAVWSHELWRDLPAIKMSNNAALHLQNHSAAAQEPVMLEALHFGCLSNWECLCKSHSLGLQDATGSFLISSQGCQRVSPHD